MRLCKRKLQDTEVHLEASPTKRPLLNPETTDIFPLAAEDINADDGVTQLLNPTCALYSDENERQPPLRRTKYPVVPSSTPQVAAKAARLGSIADMIAASRVKIPVARTKIESKKKDLVTKAPEK